MRDPRCPHCAGPTPGRIIERPDGAVLYRCIDCGRLATQEDWGDDRS